jgi:hypothetical protein
MLPKFPHRSRTCPPVVAKVGQISVIPHMCTEHDQERASLDIGILGVAN